MRKTTSLLKLKVIQVLLVSIPSYLRSHADWEDNSSVGDSSDVGNQPQTLIAVTTTASRNLPARPPFSTVQTQRDEPKLCEQHLVFRRISSLLTPPIANNITRDVNGVNRAARLQPMAKGKAFSHQIAAVPVKKSIWAEPAAIEKTRQKRDKEMREEILRKENKYLGQPANQEEVPGTVRVYIQVESPFSMD